jgi:hypothetical protein
MDAKGLQLLSFFNLAVVVLVSAAPFPSTILDDLSLLNIPFSCNTSNFTEVFINTVTDLQNIVQTRMQFPSKQFIVMTLTSVNVQDGFGNILTSAYNSSVPLPILNSSMSCTYVRGQGMSNTQVLVNKFNAIKTSGAADLVFADMTIDRYPSVSDSDINYCLWLYYNNKTHPDLTVSPCKNYTNYLLDTSGLGGGATFAASSSRVGFLRLGTSGGISVNGGVNHSVVSCVISSLMNGFTSFSNNYTLVYNNTITSFWGSGTYLNVQNYANITHNFLYDTGFSCFYCRRSFYHSYTYNFCRYFTYLPNSQTGAAGWYAWNGFGWRAWGRVIKYNWFYSPS